MASPGGGSFLTSVLSLLEDLPQKSPPFPAYPSTVAGLTSQPTNLFYQFLCFMAPCPLVCRQLFPHLQVLEKSLMNSPGLPLWALSNV